MFDTSSIPTDPRPVQRRRGESFDEDPNIEDIDDISEESDGGSGPFKSRDSEFRRMFSGNETPSRRAQLEKVIVAEMQSLTPETSEDFFASVRAVALAKMPDQGKLSLITEISIFLAEKTAFVVPFIASGFLECLNLAEEYQFEPNIRIFIAVASNSPDVISVEHVRALLAMRSVKDAPRKLLKFLSVYTANATDGTVAQNVIEQFFMLRKAFLFSVDFISITFQAYQKMASLRHGFWEVISEGILSENLDVARECCHAYCQVEFAGRDLPLAELVGKIRAGVLVREGLQVICRLQSIPASQRLTEALLSVGRASPLTAPCLSRMAKPKGFELLVENTKWMCQDCLSFSDAFRLFCRICGAVTWRNALIGTAEFPRFLIWVLMDGSDEELESVINVLNDVESDVKFIRRLEDIPFFEKFTKRCLDCEVEGLRSVCVMYMCKLAAIGWSGEYGLFICRLKGLLSGEGFVAEKALDFAFLLMAYPEAKALLLQSDILEIVRGIALEEGREEQRQELIRFIETDLCS
jgi:hypothetical protein